MYFRTAPFLLLSTVNSLMVAFQTFVKYIYIHMYVLRPLVLFLYKWAHTVHLFYNFLYSLTTS